MNKDYKVTFFMKNAEMCEIIFRNTTKQDLLEYMGKTAIASYAIFFGNETKEDYVNLNEVNYLHIEELKEEEND